MSVVYDTLKDSAITTLDFIKGNTYIFSVVGAGGGGGGSGGGKGSAGTVVSGSFKPTSKFTATITKGIKGAVGANGGSGGEGGTATTVISTDNGVTLSIIAGAGGGGNVSTAAATNKDASEGSLIGAKNNLAAAEAPGTLAGFGGGGGGAATGTNGTNAVSATGGTSFAGGSAILAGSVEYANASGHSDFVNTGGGGTATTAGQDGYIYITMTVPDAISSTQPTNDGVSTSVADLSESVNDAALEATATAIAAVDTALKAAEAAEAAETAATNSGASSTVSNSDVLKLLVALIASINKQIAALQKALREKK